MSDPILFLDIDGVLNRCGKSSQGLETEQCNLLARIVAEADPLIVVSSTWRTFDRGMQRLHTLFNQIGGRFGGVTPYLTGRPRGDEIQAWLLENKNSGRFVILDDDSDMGALLPRLIKTQSFTGLTEEITEEVIRGLKSQRGLNLLNNPNLPD